MVLPDAYLEKILSVKLFEYLACARPVVAAQSGESANLLKRSGAGLVVPPGDSCALADAILELYANPERRAAMSARGRHFVEENYSRSVWASRLEELFRELCPTPSRRRISEAPMPQPTRQRRGML
jgi:glycosyltransferase involved in cell wall biosynthesis